MIEITINGATQQIAADPATPLLWVLRDTLELTGTKYGCGKGLCGACTVHVDGVATRACVTPLASGAGKRVTTIEGLGGSDALHPVQQAWLAEDVPQCGYCQPGQIMAAAAFLATNPNPTDAEIRAGMLNLCRCGTYLRIERAIRRAAGPGKIP